MKGEPQKPWKGGLLSGRTREALQRRHRKHLARKKSAELYDGRKRLESK